MTLPLAATSSDAQAPTPLVSVIIPAYNAAATLDRTLASVRAQTYPALEILIVDDGSTDATPEIAARHGARDPRVSIIRRGNGGVAAARNAGLAAARGTYVAPIDADDLWRPENLAEQVKALELSGALFSFARSYGIDASDQVIWLPDLDRPPRVDFGGLLGANALGNASAAVFRRDAVLAIGGYDETLRARRAEGAEDWKLALALAVVAPPVPVLKGLVGYRQTGSGMSRRPRSMTRSCLLVIDEMQRMGPPLPRRDYWRARTQVLLWLAPAWWRSGDLLGFARCLAVAYLCNPLWPLEREARAFLARPFLYAAKACRKALGWGTARTEARFTADRPRVGTARDFKSLGQEAN